MKRITTITTAAALLITGCSSQPEEPQATPTTEQADSQDTLNEEDAMANETYKIGETFRVNSFDDKDTIFHWDLKVTNVETTKLLKNADDNPEYYSGDNLDAPEKVDAKPKPGNEFIHITYEQTNVSGVPTSLDLTADIEFSDGEVFAPLGDDRDYYTPNLTEQHEHPAGQTQNNNTTSKGDWVIEIPEGSEVAAILIRNILIGSEDEYRVTLT